MEERKINMVRLYQYLNLRYVPSDETIVKGEKMGINPPRVDISQVKTMPPHDIKVAITRNFSASIEECLKGMTGNKIGVFISGGLDSTIMLHFLAQHEEFKINTFTMGFGEESDELEDGRKVSDFYGTDHREIVVEDVMKGFPEMIQIMGFPKRNLWGYHLAKFASKYVDVVFDGLGADELFGGYIFRYEHALKMPHVTPSEQVRAYVQSAHLRDFIPNCKVFGSKFKGFNEGLIYDAFRKHFDRGLPFLNQFIIADLNVKCAYDFIPLFKLDEVAGLVAHTPWLSHDLIQNAFSIPLHLKIHNGSGKWILRRMFKEKIPKIAIEKKKQGFGMSPLTVWNGRLKTSVEDVLLKGDTVRDGYINREYVIDVLNKRVEEKMMPHYNKVWDALAFEIWYESWLEGKQKEV